jgi:hypothetical protein
MGAGVKLLYYRIFLTGLLACWVSACAFPDRKQDFRPRAQKDSDALIYLYRLDRGDLSADFDVPRFFINDTWIGKLKLGGYYGVETKPGNITMYLKDSLFLIPFPWKKKVVHFEAEPGEIYYVRYTKLALPPTERLEQVEPHVALQEIQQTRELENCSSIYRCP